MKTPNIQFLERLDVANLPSDRLSDYAYALQCCKFPASVIDDRFHNKVALLCDKKIKEISIRIGEEHHLSDLVEQYSESKSWYAMRRKRKMEGFTRIYQWRIVNELLKLNANDPLAQLLLLTECLEAENYAANLNLPYNFGDRPTPFSPADYRDDGVLIDHIKMLSNGATYISREQLIEIADYIQTEIVDTGKTAEHLALVTAILNTGMPNLSYPNITRALEKATNSLAKSNARSRMELAPAYYILWSQTLRSSYLSKFESTVRQCYQSLANDKTYPDLGVDKADPRSLSDAIKFLDANRQTLWILNDRYDVDKVIQKYGKMEDKAIPVAPQL